MKKKVAFLSDVHVGRRLAFHLVDDDQAALSGIGAKIEELGVGELVLAGDVLDRKLISSSDFRKVAGFIDSVIEAGAGVWTIQGNHDLSDPPWITTIDPRVRPLSKEVSDVGGWMIRGMDYTRGEEARSAIEAMGPCDVLVLHQPFLHVSPYEAYGVTPEDMAGDVGRVVFGHIHRHRVVTNSDGVVVVSLGSPRPCKIDEDPSPLTVLEPDGRFSFHRIEGAREIIRLSAWDEGFLDEAEEAALRSPEASLQVSYRDADRGVLSGGVWRAIESAVKEAGGHVVMRYLPEDRGSGIDESASAEDEGAATDAALREASEAAGGGEALTEFARHLLAERGFSEAFSGRESALAGRIAGIRRRERDEGS